MTGIDGLRQVVKPHFCPVPIVGLWSHDLICLGLISLPVGGDDSHLAMLLWEVNGIICISLRANARYNC